MDVSLLSISISLVVAEFAFFVFWYKEMPELREKRRKYIERRFAGFSQSNSNGTHIDFFEYVIHADRELIMPVDNDSTPHRLILVALIFSVIFSVAWGVVNGNGLDTSIMSNYVSLSNVLFVITVALWSMATYRSINEFRYILIMNKVFEKA